MQTDVKIRIKERTKVFLCGVSFTLKIKLKEKCNKIRELAVKYHKRPILTGAVWSYLLKYQRLMRA